MRALLFVIHPCYYSKTGLKLIDLDNAVFHTILIGIKSHPHGNFVSLIDLILLD